MFMPVTSKTVYARNYYNTIDKYIKGSYNYFNGMDHGRNDIDPDSSNNLILSIINDTELLKTGFFYNIINIIRKIFDKNWETVRKEDRIEKVLKITKVFIESKCIDNKLEIEIGNTKKIFNIDNNNNMILSINNDESINLNELVNKLKNDLSRIIENPHLEESLKNKIDQFFNKDNIKNSKDELNAEDEINKIKNRLKKLELYYNQKYNKKDQSHLEFILSNYEYYPEYIIENALTSLLKKFPNFIKDKEPDYIIKIIKLYPHLIDNDIANNINDVATYCYIIKEKLTDIDAKINLIMENPELLDKNNHRIKIILNEIKDKKYQKYQNYKKFINYVMDLDDYEDSDSILYNIVNELYSTDSAFDLRIKYKYIVHNSGKFKEKESELLIDSLKYVINNNAYFSEKTIESSIKLIKENQIVLENDLQEKINKCISLFEKNDVIKIVMNAPNQKRKTIVNNGIAANNYTNCCGIISIIDSLMQDYDNNLSSIESLFKKVGINKDVNTIDLRNDLNVKNDLICKLKDKLFDVAKDIINYHYNYNSLSLKEKIKIFQNVYGDDLYYFQIEIENRIKLLTYNNQQYKKIYEAYLDFKDGIQYQYNLNKYEENKKIIENYQLILNKFDHFICSDNDEELGSFFNCIKLLSNNCIDLTGIVEEKILKGKLVQKKSLKDILKDCLYILNLGNEYIKRVQLSEAQIFTVLNWCKYFFLEVEYNTQSFFFKKNDKNNGELKLAIKNINNYHWESVIMCKKDT
jgi:hypothetical protein